MVVNLHLRRPSLCTANRTLIPTLPSLRSLFICLESLKLTCCNCFQFFEFFFCFVFKFCFGCGVGRVMKSPPDCFWANSPPACSQCNTPTPRSASSSLVVGGPVALWASRVSEHGAWNMCFILFVCPTCGCYWCFQSAVNGWMRRPLQTCRVAVRGWQ